MRTFILLIATSFAVAFSPPHRMLDPATQMPPATAAAPVAASSAVQHRSRTATALAAARKKTADMTEEEKAAEKALNQ